jgi:hypothetical protein
MATGLGVGSVAGSVTTQMGFIVGVSPGDVVTGTGVGLGREVGSTSARTVRGGRMSNQMTARESRQATVARISARVMRTTAEEFVSVSVIRDIAVSFRRKVQCSSHFCFQYSN